MAFGTLAQLVLQNSPMEEIETVLNFCHTVGLPVTLAQMGVKEGIDEKVQAVAKRPVRKGKPFITCRSRSACRAYMRRF